MRSLFTLLLLSLSAFCHSEVLIQDDSGRTVRLAHPARRIASLAPHITETLFAAGVGAQVIATVDYSDYPPAASQLPRIGSFERVDLEALLLHKPDLVIVWQSGNPSGLIEKIRALGLPLYINQSSKIDDLARDLERFGYLGGQAKSGEEAALRFRQKLALLRVQYADKPKVRVFYEVWNQPLMTVGGPQVISDVIRLCGGENIFSSLRVMAPIISAEAVLAARPEAIVAAGMGDARPEWLDDWKIWPTLPAVVQGNLFHIHPDLMHRHSPRLLDGAARLCEQLEEARQRRK